MGMLNGEYFFQNKCKISVERLVCKDCKVQDK